MMRVFVLTFMLLLLMPCLIFADTPSYDYDLVSVEVDGDIYYENESLLINGITYVQYEDYLSVLSAEKNIDFDINLNTDYNCVIANDRYLYYGDSAVYINDNLYLPIRFISKIFGADITWNGSLKRVSVTTGTDLLENGEIYYDYDDVYWLSRIICAESDAESLEGKLAVGTIIMNRVTSADFPNDIYNVIFDSENGVQFTPVRTKRIYTTPDDECVIAAKICLDGYRTDPNILYFIDESKAVNKWVPNNRNYLFTIGCHDFYS
jgi:Cell wall hydrolyses involved in spore germination